jgi:hypothetical protein
MNSGEPLREFLQSCANIVRPDDELMFVGGVGIG